MMVQMSYLCNLLSFASIAFTVCLEADVVLRTSLCAGSNSIGKGALTGMRGGKKSFDR